MEPEVAAAAGERPAELEARRWRLLARLAGALSTGDPDCATCATAAAELLADELGDVAVVMVLDPPGHDDPIMGLGLRSESDRPAIEAVLQQASPADLRTLCEQMAVTGVPVVTDPLPPGAGDWYRTAYAAYADLIEAGGAAHATLSRAGGSLGLVVCARLAGSPAFTEEDLSAIAAAADRISLLLEVMVARTAERAAHRQARLSFEAAQLAMGVMGSDGRIRAVNEAGCVLYGRTAEELIGHSWVEFTHPDDIHPERMVLDELLVGAARHGVATKRIIRPSGEVRWARITMTLVPDEGGRPDAFYGQLLDITDQMAAEARAERFAALVQSSPDFVAIASLEGVVEFVNEAGRALIGLAPDVDVGTTSVPDYFTPESRVLSEEEERPAVLREGVWRGVATLRDWRDDSGIPVEAVSFVLRDPVTGQPAALATVQRDIRERLAAQRALEDLAEQQRLLLGELLRAEQAERQRIAADVHDESVQLLAAAQLRLQLLDAQLARVDAGNARQSVANLRDLVVGALQRLRQLLVELEPPEQLRDGLDDAVRQVARRLFDGTDVAVEVRGALRGVSPEAAAVLHRAAGEALSNARRHAGARRVTVALEEDGTSWGLCVEDDGSGIASDLPARAGHLGIRGMTSRIEALGGTCRVGQRPQGGTRVEISVPTPQSARRSAAL